MSSDNAHFNSLIQLLLPPEIFEYFDIVNVHLENKEVHIHLDEKAVRPEGYEIVKLISKGFHQASIIQDFPLRDKALFLHVRRRRWYSESTRKTVKNTGMLLQRELV